MGVTFISTADKVEDEDIFSNTRPNTSIIYTSLGDMSQS